MDDHGWTRPQEGPSEPAGEDDEGPRSPQFVDERGDSWLLRPARDDDRDPLVEMYDGFAPGERAQGLPPRTRSRIESWVDDRLADGCNLVVAGEDGIVGHALYTPTDDDVPEFAVFVHQDYQNRGIGTEVSKRLVARAASTGREALTLVVEPGNRPARKLYDRLGFETVEEHSFDGGRRLGALRMRLALDATEGVNRERASDTRCDHSRP